MEKMKMAGRVWGAGLGGYVGMELLWVQGRRWRAKMAGGPWLCSENNNQGPRGTTTFLLAGRVELGEGAAGLG